MGVGGQSHAPVTLPPGKTLYPLYRRLGGPQDWYGWVWKITPSPGFDPQTVQPVASRYTDLCWFIPYLWNSCFLNTSSAYKEWDKKYLNWIITKHIFYFPDPILLAMAASQSWQHWVRYLSGKANSSKQTAPWLGGVWDGNFVEFLFIE
jgi:hypothetical protein